MCLQHGISVSIDIKCIWDVIIKNTPINVTVSLDKMYVVLNQIHIFRTT